MNHIKAIPSLLILATLVVGPMLLVEWLMQDWRVTALAAVGSVGMVPVAADVVSWCEGVWT